MAPVRLAHRSRDVRGGDVSRGRIGNQAAGRSALAGLVDPNTGVEMGESGVIINCAEEACAI